MTDLVTVLLDDVRHGAPVEVGTLAQERRGSAEVVRFAYSHAWLAGRDAFPLGPDLPLYPGDHFPNAMFGIFRDTAPDRWGRVLMERREAVEARADSRKTRRLGEWDFLLGVSDVARMGALRLRDGERFVDDRALDVPPVSRLRKLQAIARRVERPGSEERPEYAEWLRQLLAPGTSLGGARPKATFVDTDGALWLAKFPGRQDRHDVGAWEWIAHQLAQSAGIRVPEARLLKLGGAHHTYCARRFDREGGGRRLYASAMTLSDRKDGDRASYLEIAQTIQDQGDPDTLGADLAQLYRRLVFNVLVGNRDDHLRNHGFLRSARGWSLAPAFDVNPNPDKAEHAITFDESSGAADLAVVRGTRELYRLTAAAAVRIEREVRRAFDDWPSVARAAGIPRGELQLLETVIDPAR